MQLFSCRRAFAAVLTTTSVLQPAAAAAPAPGQAPVPFFSEIEPNLTPGPARTYRGALETEALVQLPGTGIARLNTAHLLEFAVQVVESTPDGGALAQITVRRAVVHSRGGHYGLMLRRTDTANAPDPNRKGAQPTEPMHWLHLLVDKPFTAVLSPTGHVTEFLDLDSLLPDPAAQAEASRLFAKREYGWMLRRALTPRAWMHADACPEPGAPWSAPFLLLAPAQHRFSVTHESHAGARTPAGLHAYPASGRMSIERVFRSSPQAFEPASGALSGAVVWDPGSRSLVESTWSATIRTRTVVRHTDQLLPHQQGRATINTTFTLRRGPSPKP